MQDNYGLILDIEKMSRLFQHYEGEIYGLIGRRLENLKKIVDKLDQEIPVTELKQCIKATLNEKN